jgi:hypothetical protein
MEAQPALITHKERKYFKNIIDEFLPLHGNG